MSRITKYDKQLEKYVLMKNAKEYTENDLIQALGEKEDNIDQLTQRSAALIESMMELLEITKGEKEDLMKKIQSFK